MTFQRSWLATTAESVVLATDGRMSSWSARVFIAEAKKADVASETVVRTPSPPSLIGKHAWVHWSVDSSTFRMASNPRRMSNIISRSLSWQLFVRKMCMTVGTLIQCLIMTSEWCALKCFSILSIFCSLLHLSSRATSSPRSDNMGEPRSCASRISIIWKPGKVFAISKLQLLRVRTSHFEMFNFKPNRSPSNLIKGNMISFVYCVRKIIERFIINLRFVIRVLPARKYVFRRLEKYQDYVFRVHIPLECRFSGLFSVLSRRLRSVHIATKISPVLDVILGDARPEVRMIRNFNAVRHWDIIWCPKSWYQ